ncbi:unnamed protein product, partial [Laminaria digitata]
MVNPPANIAAGDCSPDSCRNGNAMLDDKAIEVKPAGMGFRLDTNADVMNLLAELLSNQYVFFAGVSKDWKTAWGRLPKITQAITAKTTVSQ